VNHPPLSDDADTPGGPSCAGLKRKAAAAKWSKQFSSAAATLSLSLGERVGVRASVDSDSTSAAPLSPSYLYSLETAKNRLFFTRWLLLTLLATVTV